MEEEESQGSMLLGVLLGFFLNCFGVVVAFVMQGSKTITGAIIGMVLQWVAVMCLGVTLGIVNAVFMSSY
jgi:hypothetical protein